MSQATNNPQGLKGDLVVGGALTTQGNASVQGGNLLVGDAFKTGLGVDQTTGQTTLYLDRAVDVPAFSVDGSSGVVTFAQPVNVPSVTITGNIGAPVATGAAALVGPGTVVNAVGFDFATAGPAGAPLPAGVYECRVKCTALQPAPFDFFPGDFNMVIFWDGTRVTGPALGGIACIPYTDANVTDLGWFIGLVGVVGFQPSQLVAAQSTASGTTATSNVVSVYRLA